MQFRRRTLDELTAMTRAGAVAGVSAETDASAFQRSLHRKPRFGPLPRLLVRYCYYAEVADVRDAHGLLKQQGFAHVDAAEIPTPGAGHVYVCATDRR